ncbi:aldo/keto reductase [Weissella paramesenteroides]|uniref:aldo/keto reductase n=1 Tax=Weissella paramesenteroides TaxID=1249 RepID=UPI0023F657AA|nr:aldo/keto reductase [Weissella paramesenteroides]MDF8373932.1 aldo/keto reductase [Weissella paramesenteroides]WIG65472.1 aldo/keto reductase [Weissella paramesenteroides]
MTEITNMKLNDNVEIPVYGFGTFMIPADGSTKKAVKEVLDSGIRHIDTAAAYFNEQEVGQAIRESNIPREEVFVTSKLWLQDFGYEAAKKGIEMSLQKLGLDYIDLYLIHQPYGDVVGAWKAMEEAKAAGKIRSIGVSNMTVKIWNQYVPDFETLPSVNQVEYNPYFQQKELRHLMDQNNVHIESWGPLGQGNEALLNDPVISNIAEKYGKDTGQIILKFEIQDGIIVFPKSTNPKRIRTNKDLFDFELTANEMQQMRNLDKGQGSHNPDAPGVKEFLLSTFDVHADN